MNDIIKIIKSLEDLNALTDGIIETVRQEMKKKQKNKKAHFVQLC